MTDKEIITRAKQVFKVEIDGLKKTAVSVGGDFVAAVKLFLKVTQENGIVVVTGVGKNLYVAEKISAIFASTGTRSIVLNPVQAMHGDLGMVSPRDVLLALSFSGESDEVVRLIPAIRRHGLKVVSMTGRPDSTLAKLSDIHVNIPCGKEACPFGMAPTNSVTSTLAMGDAMAMTLIDARRFSIKDYAANHPAGAIGRALILKVVDIMRTGENLATLSMEATVMDAALAMTKAKTGSALIVDGKGKLQGIFTDGDFRRLVTQQKNLTLRNSKTRKLENSKTSSAQDFLEYPVASVMTKSPSFVRDDVYAAELLKIFEQKRIDDLPVCDAQGRVVGLVDIQDLPKMKVL